MLEHHFDLSKDTPAKASTRRRVENSRVSDNSYMEYEAYLGLNTGEMVGKKVLDIGTGYGNTFAKEAAEKGINVITITSDKGADTRHNQSNPSVFARAQQLPFADNSYDYVVSLLGVPLYLIDNKEEYESFLAETIRVLKPGGRAYFAPIMDTSRRLLMRVLKKIDPNVCSCHLDPSTNDKFARLELIKK